jgi:dTDP-4-dehydrorhamnose reductase
MDTRPNEMNAPSSKRVVVVGSGGRLGSCLAGKLRQRHQVTALGRADLDLARPDSITAALGPLDYELLVLTGALTAVDYCESHEREALAVNAEGPGRIAEISADKGAHVTYVSTDFVFDGLKPAPYVEDDDAYPISVYGATKLAGEERVLAASADNLVTRVSWVFGPGRAAFPEWIIRQACAGADLTLPGDKTGCPTYTLDLIEWMSALLFDLPDGPASGIYHLCNANPCTWRDWGQCCIDAARQAGAPVIAGEIRGVPVDSVAAFVAKRPLNSVLDTGKFTATTGIHPRAWQEALREFVMRKPQLPS